MTKQTNRKPGAIAAANATAPDAYTRITNRIVADLEQGVRPWCKPWSGDQLGASPDHGGPTVNPIPAPRALQAAARCPPPSATT